MLKVDSGRIQHIAAWGLLALFVSCHLVLIGKTFIIDEEGNMRAAVAGFGDIPFHMTQISKFAYLEDLNFNEPIFHGERMRYAFLINFLSGMILRATGDWQLAMHLPSMTMITLGTALAFLCYSRLLKSPWAALAAVVVFLLGSGFGDWPLINDQWLGRERTFTEFAQYLTDNGISTISRWDAVYPQQNIDWGAPLSLVFLHQRAFFFGFFLFTAFVFLVERWRRVPDLKTTLLLGLTIGIGPLAHYHSFLAMLLVLGLTALFRLLKKNPIAWKRFFLLGGIVTLLTLPQVVYLTQGKEGIMFAENSFIEFRLGWMVQPTIGSVLFQPAAGWLQGCFLPSLKFLWVNFGVVLPMALAAVAFALRPKRCSVLYPEARFWALTAAAFFAAVETVRFQPWDFDNNKMLVYFQFFAAPAIIAFLLLLAGQRKKLGAILVGAFVVLAVHAGVVDEMPRWQVPVRQMPIIFDGNARALAEFIRTNIPEDKLVLTSSTHLNPVDSLAGRPVLVGYSGWLWSRGISYAQREQELKRFYADPGAAGDVLDKYDVGYIVLDPTTLSQEWSARQEIFDRRFRLLFSHGPYRLYQVTDEDPT